MLFAAFAAATFAGLTPPADSQNVAAAKPELARRLQAAAERAMAGRTGAAVVLDVESGRILAEHRLDLAARTLARPGSTVKPIVLKALLESGKLGAGRTRLCRRQVRIAGRLLDCSHPADPRPLGAAAALAYSCNSWFSEAALLLDDEEIARAFSRAGLTAATGLAESEVTGSVRAPRSAEERQLLALGEESIEVSPLGLLAAYRRLALARRDSESACALAPVFDGLEGSVAYGMGTQAGAAGLEVAGKTGTASSAAGWTHAWFAGFAPAAAPEVVLMVFLEKGRGGADAAPVAGQVFAAYAAAHAKR
jgi:cell division protein FtsI/penicillin-binding protein 2